jgi:hypothetical protein
MHVCDLRFLVDADDAVLALAALDFEEECFTSHAFVSTLRRPRHSSVKSKYLIQLRFADGECAALIIAELVELDGWKVVLRSDVEQIQLWLHLGW